MNIFIVHPSRVVTDHAAHGDGLLSYRYICELARRGHVLAVACENVDLRNPVPQNVTLFPIALKAKSSLLRRVEYMVKMRRLFNRLHRNNPFQIAHQLNPVFRGLSLGLILSGIPIVLGPYVDYWGVFRPVGLKLKLIETLSWLQQSMASAVIISGEAARARVVAGRHVQNGTFVIPYGVDLDVFRSQPMPTGDPTIVFLAGLAERKGILVLLDAFEIVSRSVPKLQLIIAGEGELGEQVRSIVRQSAHAERIRCVGRVNRDKVPDLLAQATLICAPSFGEPYGMNIVEAMASGRAVVATDAGGPVDLVRPAGGVLVRPRDAAALADAIESVIGTPELARKMGMFNENAAQAYGWPVVIDQLEALYTRVCASDARRRRASSSNDIMLVQEG